MSTTLILFFLSPKHQRLSLYMGLCLFGLLRFDLIVPNLPPDLQPLSPGSWFIVNQDVHAASRFDPRHYTNALRHRLQQRSRALLSQDQADVLNGLLWGAPLSNFRLKQQFRQAGLSHLTAVSGGNLTFAMLTLAPFLRPLRLRQRTRLSIQLLVLALFVLFVGPSASVLRAATMLSLFWLAPLSGRLANTKYILLLTACLFCLWQPWSLLFDPGFHLSYLAMIGLLTWSSWFNHRLKRLPMVLREPLATSLGVTITVGPYIAWAFQQSSLIGVLANLIAAPLIPALMSIGALTLAFGWPGWSIVPIQLLLNAFITLAQYASRFASTASLSFTSLLCLELVCFFLWHLIHTSRRIQMTSTSSDKSEITITRSFLSKNDHLEVLSQTTNTIIRDRPQAS